MLDKFKKKKNLGEQMKIREKKEQMLNGKRKKKVKRKGKRKTTKPQ